MKYKVIMYDPDKDLTHENPYTGVNYFRSEKTALEHVKRLNRSINGNLAPNEHPNTFHIVEF